MNIRSCILVLLFIVNTASADAKNYYVIDGVYEDNGIIKLWYTMLGLLDDYDASRCAGFQIAFDCNGKYYDAKYGPNWWNYYFAFSSIGTPKQDSVVRLARYQRSIMRFKTACTMLPERGNFLLNKYVQLQPALQEKIEHIKREYFSYNMPAIGVYYQKPIMPEVQRSWDPSDLGERVKQEIRDLDNYRIYLFTDQDGFTEVFEQEFGARYSVIPMLKYNKDASRVEQGEHEFLTLLSLALCDLVIAPGSYQGMGAKILNPTLKLIELDTIPYART